MSKKNKFKNLPKTIISQTQTAEDRLTMGFRNEYNFIKSELTRVLFLNFIYFGILLSIYFTNNQHKYLERWFEKFF